MRSPSGMTMPLRRRLLRAARGIGLIAALAAGTTVATAEPAAATPENCLFNDGAAYQVFGYTTVTCSGGRGYYQAVVFCSVTPYDSLKYWHKGVWRSVTTGGQSSAQCNAAHPYGRGGTFLTAE